MKQEAGMAWSGKRKTIQLVNVAAVHELDNVSSNEDSSQRSRQTRSTYGSYQKSLDFRLDSGSPWLDGVNGILMQQEPNSPKKDYWNQRAIASLANTLITVMEPVPMPLLSSILLLQL
jgi:hypothetical protein